MKLSFNSLCFYFLIAFSKKQATLFTRTIEHVPKTGSHVSVRCFSAVRKTEIPHHRKDKVKQNDKKPAWLNLNRTGSQDIFRLPRGVTLSPAQFCVETLCNLEQLFALCKPLR
jgi:hypothetical protein